MDIITLFELTDIYTKEYLRLVFAAKYMHQEVHVNVKERA